MSYIGNYRKYLTVHEVIYMIAQISCLGMCISREGGPVNYLEYASDPSYIFLETPPPREQNYGSTHVLGSQIEGHTLYMREKLYLETKLCFSG